MNRWAALGAAALHASLLGYLFLGTAPVLLQEPRRAPVRIRAATRAVQPPPAPVVEPVAAPPAVPEIAPKVAPVPR